ncbi:hypothetical protein QIT82_gp48 [Pseudomonas phage psageK9]|uniref:Uncharacterized protein n=1 Tax=Pseudomonas phage psageK9 TaxID=2875722 RepID=A0AAE8XML8_9CAUD|nr:hypothetical protein QIT82_gp48 [Pseudomonas phage psageK9]UAW53918.1 hypothetical protein psageK9_48 [Pseudomonas phage psageK9]
MKHPTTKSQAQKSRGAIPASCAALANKFWSE